MHSTAKRLLLSIRSNWQIVLLALVALIAHFALRGIYKPNSVDEPWTLSFIRNYWGHGIETDISFGNQLTEQGQNGLAHFGKIQALVYAPILSAADWDREIAHAISFMLIVLSVMLWYRIFSRVCGSRATAIVATLLVCISEPVIAAANSARPEALTFLLVSGAVLASLKRRHFIAGLCTALAVEVHPMGVTALIYIAAAHLSEHELSRAGRRLSGAALRTGAGVLAGALAYVVLHLGALMSLSDAIRSNNSGGIGASFVRYTFDSAYFRHVPEFLLFVAVLFVFLWRRLYRQHRLAVWSLVAAAGSMLILQRANHNYMIYYVPIFIFLLVLVADHLRKRWAAALLFFALMLPQYAITYAQNRYFDIGGYVLRMRSALPPAATPVVAEPNGWFAFYDREFYASYYNDESYFFGRERFAALDLSRFYLIDRLDKASGETLGWRTHVMPATYSCEEFERFTLQRRDYGVFLCLKQAE